MVGVEKQMRTDNSRSSNLENSEELEKHIFGSKALRNQSPRQIWIVSPDWLIQDFLYGILTFQGQSHIKVRELQEIFCDRLMQSDDIMFLDGVYLMGPESERVRGRVQVLTQAGVHVLVLVERLREADVEVIWDAQGYQLLRKPLDYRKVGQVIAQMS